ncbi:MAG TPA: PrsW family glutamic-type intramembrane protease [Caulobacteraceae bacterium]|jgi:RsiW-degrading membrane proteinase PrsW (M82 family)
MDLLKIAVALVPVLVFLAGFTLLDAFKLMSWRWLVILLVAGGLLAAASYLANWRALDDLPIGFTDYTKYAAPVIEESLKGALMLALFWRNRIGFMIDAAITGFAIGAGFSLVENFVYLHDYVGSASLGVWLVRGFGTAVMHGGSTAAYGVVGQFLMERRMKVEGARYRFHLLIFLPGLILAMLIHGAYNHFPHEPILSMAVVLVVVPLSLVLVFSKSEHTAHTWLLNEYETHEHMMADIDAGKFDASEAGRFILTMSERFGPDVATKAFAYLKLHTDLVLRAEQALMAHEAGEKVPLSDVRAEFQQLHEIEKDLGPAALMALRPHLQFSRHELWEMHELQREAHAA